MERHIKRNECNEKKIDYKVKDSGDSKKSNYREGNMKVVHLERGDSGQRKISATNQKSEQMRLKIDKTKTNEDPKSKFLIYSTAEKDVPRKNNYQDNVAKSYSEIRKRIRDRYTFKYNVPVNKSDHLSLYKSNKGGTIVLSSDGINRPITIRVPTDPGRPAKSPAKPLPEETPRINEKQIPSGQSDLVLVEKPDSISETIQKIPDKIPENPEKIPAKPDKIIPRPRWKINSPTKRKPIIKTVVSKTDTAKVFKAVTFVDDIDSTPLEIKIPGDNNMIKKQQKVSKYTETTSLKKLKSKPNLPTVRTVKSNPSKETIKMEAKPTRTTIVRKRPTERRRRFRKLSPNLPLEAACPPTEVARWVPQSVDPQTKPYYDAWLDTTLTATSQHPNKNKSIYDYHMRLLKSFKKALEERPPSPDLFYEKFADEKYAGRIRIRQTDRHGRT